MLSAGMKFFHWQNFGAALQYITTQGKFSLDSNFSPYILEFPSDSTNATIRHVRTEQENASVLHRVNVLRECCDRRAVFPTPGWSRRWGVAICIKCFLHSTMPCLDQVPIIHSPAYSSAQMPIHPTVTGWHMFQLQSSLLRPFLSPWLSTKPGSTTEAALEEGWYPGSQKNPSISSFRAFSCVISTLSCPQIRTEYFLSTLRTK